MAEPYLKEGKWYSAYKDRHGRWRNALLKAVTTKADARRQNSELQLREDRIRKGIEPAPLENADETFGDLLNWWIERRLRRSALSTSALGRSGSTLSAHASRACRRRRSRPPRSMTSCREGRRLSASSVNHLRAYIRAAINAAIDAERFYGRNPITRAVKKRREPKRKPQYLKPEWVPKILDNVPDRWRGCRDRHLRRAAEGRDLRAQEGRRRPRTGLLYVRRRTAPTSRKAATRTASRSPKSCARTA